jgi:hypothetical protein
VAEELAAQVENIEAVSCIADAVDSSDIICVCLSDDAAVEALFSLIIDEASVAGRLFVDLSTIHPETASAQAQKLQRLGAEYLGSPSKHNDTICYFTWVYRDSPNTILVFGGVPLAEARQVTLVLAGSSQAISKFRPFTTGV